MLADGEREWATDKGDAPNKRMHATRDTTDVINPQLVGGRVMRGVRRYIEG